MILSFAEVSMAVLASNVLIIFAALLLKLPKAYKRVGYWPPFIILSLAILRFCVPQEFTFTQNVSLLPVMSEICAAIQHSYVIGDISFSIWKMLKVIWCLGSIWCLCKYLFSYMKVVIQLPIATEITMQEPYAKIIEQLKVDLKIKYRYRIYRTKVVSSACIFGVLRPCIILPDYLILSQEDLANILEHEMRHYKNGDLLFKMFVNVFCSIYWWNPFCHIIKRKIEFLQDIRVDDQITYRSLPQKKSYARTLIKVAEQQVDQCDCIYASGFLTSKEELKERIDRILFCQKVPISRRVICVISIILALFVFLGSYAFILEAKCTISAEDTSMGMGVDSPEFYVILREDGKYDLFYMGTYIETIDDLKYYPVTIIYDQKGNVIYED